MVIVKFVGYLFTTFLISLQLVVVHESNYIVEIYELRYDVLLMYFYFIEVHEVRAVVSNIVYLILN